MSDVSLDEFEGMSVKDIAYTITLSEEDTEDQLRAIEAIRRRAPGIGHNRPPLAERLDEDFAALSVRSADLLRVATDVRIVDDESAGKVVDLIRQCSVFEDDVEALRRRLLKPYDDAIALINQRAAEIKGPVQIARQGPPAERGRGGLRGLSTAYDDTKRREAEEERQRAQEEQRRREAEAAEARRQAEEQAAAGKSNALASLKAADALAAAERAAARADAAKPAPVRGNLGQTTRSRVIRFEIEDLRKAIGWALRKESGLASRVHEDFEKAVRVHLRGLGVELVEQGVEIPGVRVWVELGAVNVRR